MRANKNENKNQVCRTVVNLEAKFCVTDKTISTNKEDCWKGGKSSTL